MYSSVGTTWIYCSKHVLLGKRSTHQSSVHPAATMKAIPQQDKGKLMTFTALLPHGITISRSHSCVCQGTVTKCWIQTESLGGTAGPDPLMSAPTAPAGVFIKSQVAWSHEAETVAQLIKVLVA